MTHLIFTCSSNPTKSSNASAAKSLSANTTASCGKWFTQSRMQRKIKRTTCLETRHLQAHSTAWDICHSKFDIEIQYFRVPCAEERGASKKGAGLFPDGKDEGQIWCAGTYVRTAMARLADGRARRVLGYQDRPGERPSSDP